MIKLIYTVFTGALVALFIGFGVATFYAGPQQPKAPDFASFGSQPSKEQQKQADDYSKQMQAFMDAQKPYHRNVALITFIAAVALVVVSVLWAARLGLLADGLMLGGLFTLVYSLIRSLMSDNHKFSFAVVTGGLLVTLLLGYRRFVRAAVPAKKPAKRRR